MASVIDFSELTFSTEQIRDLSELMFDAIVEAEAFSKFHTVIPGVEYDKEIGYVGEIGLVGKAGQGCDPVADTWNLEVTKKTWEPKTWEIIRDECFTDLANTLAIYAKKFGTEEPDLTNTAYMAMVEDRLRIAIQKMLWRITWFSDTNAANTDASPAGTITAGVSTSYFNLLKGFFIQLDEIVIADSARRTTIAANNSVTQALQISDLTPTLAYGYLQSTLYGAHPALRAQAGKVGFVTRTVLDKAEQYLMDKSIVPTYQNIINGFDFGAPGLKLFGVTWFPIDIWDEIILAYYNNGTTLYRPHRVVLTTIENLMVGVPSTDIIEFIKIHYDDTTRKNRIEARDKIDAKISRDKLVQVAW